MSPLNHNLDGVDNLECIDNEEGVVVFENRSSDMRRVSMSLAFSPARQRRRRQIKFINSWLRSKLGISGRRYTRID